MTDPIDDRLARLEEYVQLLEGLRNKDIKDPYTRGALERYLHLAAEASLDIGEILIAKEGLPKADTYRGIIRSLNSAGILDDDLTGRFEGIAGLRNILVHDYTRIDPDRLLGFLSRLDDFRRYAQAVARHLGAREGVDIDHNP